MKITAPIALALAYAVVASSEHTDVHKNHMPAAGEDVPSNPHDMKDYLDRKLLALKPHYYKCALTSSNETPHHSCDDKAFQDIMKIIHDKIEARGQPCPKHLANTLDELDHHWRSCQNDFTHCSNARFNKDIKQATTALDEFMFAAQEVKVNDEGAELYAVRENNEDAVDMIVVEQDPTVMSQ